MAASLRDANLRVSEKLAYVFHYCFERFLSNLLDQRRNIVQLFGRG